MSARDQIVVLPGTSGNGGLTSLKSLFEDSDSEREEAAEQSRVARKKHKSKQKDSEQITLPVWGGSDRWGDTFGPVWTTQPPRVPPSAHLPEGFIAKKGSLAELRMPEDGGKSIRRLRRARDRAVKALLEEAGVASSQAGDDKEEKEGGKHKSIAELEALVSNLSYIGADEEKQSKKKRKGDKSGAGDAADGAPSGLPNASASSQATGGGGLGGAEAGGPRGSAGGASEADPSVARDPAAASATSAAAQTGAEGGASAGAVDADEMSVEALMRLAEAQKETFAADEEQGAQAPAQAEDAAGEEAPADGADSAVLDEAAALLEALGAAPAGGGGGGGKKKKKKGKGKGGGDGEGTPKAAAPGQGGGAKPAAGKAPKGGGAAARAAAEAAARRSKGGKKKGKR